MHKNRRRSADADQSTARRAFRPSLNLIERRRREQLDDRGTLWWQSAAPVRAAAACVLALFGFFISGGLAITANFGVTEFVDPAFAATVPLTRAFAHATIGRREAATKLRRFFAATSAPATPVPATSAPATPAPATSAPATSAPATSAPAASVPVTPPQVKSAPPTPLLAAQPWRLTADGTWATVVSYALAPNVDRANADIEFSSSSADVLPLDAHAEGAPGAIVTVASGDQPVDLRADARTPALGAVTLELSPPPTGLDSFAAAAQSIGPHLIDVGWTALADRFGVVEYKVYRRKAGSSKGELVGIVSPSGHAWQDAAVTPTTAYRYSVVALLADGAAEASTRFVATPPIMQPTSAGAVSGKGMFLYFSPDAADGNGYVKYDPDTVIARAKGAGVGYIELRMARGTFFEGADPGAHAWLDAFVDKADAAGINLLAWQVPRRATSADAAEAVAAARYRTAAGNGFAGLALDIEDGDNYMGLGDAAKERMVDQIQMVRAAVGPDFVIVATVMSPKLTHWTNRRYPYNRIAPYATVLQPMEYWHHFYASTHHDYTQDEVTRACADSVSLTRSLAGRDIPINVAGQSDDLGLTGPPSPDEILWCLTGSKAAGAVGDTFFDWRGTNEDNWSAISGFAW